MNNVRVYIYSFGSGGNGSLGLQNTEDYNTPQCMYTYIQQQQQYYNDEKNERISCKPCEQSLTVNKLVCGGCHTLIISGKH